MGLSVESKLDAFVFMESAQRVHEAQTGTESGESSESESPGESEWDVEDEMMDMVTEEQSVSEVSCFVLESCH